jgi:hypothetical protein
VVGSGGVQAARDGQQHVAGLLGLEDRHHDGLNERGEAGARHVVAPALEEVVVRQQQVRHAARLVEHRRERRNERHHAERLLDGLVSGML